MRSTRPWFQTSSKCRPIRSRLRTSPISPVVAIAPPPSRAAVAPRDADGLGGQADGAIGGAILLHSLADGLPDPLLLGGRDARERRRDVRRDIAGVADI